MLLLLAYYACFALIAISRLSKV